MCDRLQRGSARAERTPLVSWGYDDRIQESNATPRAGVHTIAVIALESVEFLSSSRSWKKFEWGGHQSKLVYFGWFCRICQVLFFCFLFFVFCREGVTPCFSCGRANDLQEGFAGEANAAHFVESDSIEHQQEAEQVVPERKEGCHAFPWHETKVDPLHTALQLSKTRKKWLEKAYSMTI